LPNIRMLERAVLLLSARKIIHLDRSVAAMTADISLGYRKQCLKSITTDFGILKRVVHIPDSF
ncbi:hypothetical protein L9F63_016988, partial [Diploptera punctata]